MGEIILACPKLNSITGLPSWRYLLISGLDRTFYVKGCWPGRFSDWESLARVRKHTLAVWWSAEEACCLDWDHEWPFDGTVVDSRPLHKQGTREFKHNHFQQRRVPQTGVELLVKLTYSGSGRRWRGSSAGSWRWLSRAAAARRPLNHRSQLSRVIRWRGYNTLRLWWKIIYMATLERVMLSMTVSFDYHQWWAFDSFNPTSIAITR